MRGGGRLTNLALLCLLTLAFFSGCVAFELSGQPARATLVIHAAAGVAIVLLVPWKALVARRGLRRPRALRWASLVLAPLETGHGFPVRLVVPGRRGFAWVKWVASVEPDAAPWWWQPPFPLQ